MDLTNCHILITGADGFIGKNLIMHLAENADVTLSTFVRGDDVETLPQLLNKVDAVVHLAGENRPVDEAAFKQVNSDLTSILCNAIAYVFRISGRHIPLILASSTQVELDTSYGKSKLAAEKALYFLSSETRNPCVIFRLPGVFGKWCKPNYNSVVATFCHNVAHELPIRIDNPSKALQLVYIDDVVQAIVKTLKDPTVGLVYSEVSPVYSITVEELANQIRTFFDSRSTLMTERVGAGFVRALYATYVSYLPSKKFSYCLPKHSDPRGIFVEMLKTPDSGQFSYFTAHPGVSRGGHYHHTKTEKFLVIKGEALFRFRHLLTNEFVELRTSSDFPQVVQTIPGWAHDITNVGDDEMIVMLWANENFDPKKPDTISSEIL